MKKNLQTKFSSRQYMLSGDFEIYYYCDRELKKVESHVHDYYEFYFFLEGDVSIEIEKEAQPLLHGDMVMIPPGLSHHCLIHSLDQPYRRFVLWITPAYCEQLLQLSSCYGYLMQEVMLKKEYIIHNDAVTFNAIQFRVFQLIEEIHANRFGRQAQVDLYLQELILMLNRLVYEQKHLKTHTKKIRFIRNSFCILRNIWMRIFHWNIWQKFFMSAGIMWHIRLLIISGYPFTSI